MPITLESLQQRLNVQHHQHGRAFVAIDGYNENGLVHKPIQDLTIYKDQEVVTLEQWWSALQKGAFALLDSTLLKVIVRISDTFNIPENDRNGPIDLRPGHEHIVGYDQHGFPIPGKKITGDPGDQYYPFPSEPKYENLLQIIRHRVAQHEVARHLAESIAGRTQLLQDQRRSGKKRARIVNKLQQLGLLPPVDNTHIIYSGSSFEQQEQFTPEQLKVLRNR